MKSRQVTTTGLFAACVAAVTLMIGLVTNAASEQQQWPGWLSLVQRYPWPSFALLAVIAIILAATLQSVSSDRKGVTPDAQQTFGSTAVLRTLPRDIAGFTNRKNEIDQIVNDLVATEMTTPIRTIDGMPGVGKTAFAIHVGHLLAPRFPDGQFFLNLNGHTPGREPVGPAEALASLLLSDGVAPQRIPNGDDQWAVTEARASMWRARVADRRMLLILDNAATYAQVEPLLPGAARSLVLVTSRRRLAAPDALSLQMRPLTAEDAAALLARHAGRGRLDGPAVAGLVAVCGALPLALSLLAARLRHHPAWSINDLRERLLAAQHRLSEMQTGERAVAAAFDMSYQDLPPERQRFFRLLSRFPGVEIDDEAAAAMGSVSAATARVDLEALYEDHLLDETGPGRYRFHDLVRDYGRSLADDDEREGTMPIERLAGHYLTTIGAANTYIGRGATATATRFDSRAAAAAWLDAERANVLACVQECVRQQQHILVFGLAAAMAQYLRHAGPWDQAADLHRTAIVAARHAADRDAEADALGNLGMVNRLMASYRAAVEALDESLRIYRETGNLDGQASVLNQLGIVHYLTAAYEHGAQAQIEALELCRRTGNLLGQANALADLGMVKRMTGDLRASAEASNEALGIYRRIGDRYGEANALRDIGLVLTLTGHYSDAEFHTREALTIYTEIGDPVHEAYALNELGVARRLQDDLDGATEAHQQAITRYIELGDRFGEANAIRHLGVLHRLQDDHEAAIVAQERAIAVYREVESRGGLAAATVELGVLHRLGGDLAAARIALDSAGAWYAELGDRTGQLEVHNHFGTLHLDTGDTALAKERHETALSLARELGVPLQEAHALEGMARCERIFGRPDEADRPEDAARTLYEQLRRNRHA